MSPQLKANFTLATVLAIVTAAVTVAVFGFQEFETKDEADAMRKGLEKRDESFVGEIRALREENRLEHLQMIDRLDRLVDKRR